MPTEKQLNIILESELEFKPYTNTSNMSENHPNYAPDTDARSQAPTFDEMVAMIEKLFKDYLKDIRKNALTDEQIEEGWQRYKTLNHLYQDEQPKPAGAVWVKASQFKYQLETDYFYKFEYLGETRKGVGEFNSDGLFVLSHGPMLPPVAIDKVFLLDESGAASNNDAIEFAEWCAFNYQRDFEPLDSSLPINERKYRQFWVDNDQTEYTTTDLRKLWQQSKNK